MSIMSSAPYVVTILVSVMSWTLSTYYSEMNEVAFLHKKLSVTATEDGPRSEYVFTNVSPKARFSNMKVSIVCSGEICFASLDEAGELYAELVNVAPWAIGHAPIGTMQEITQRADLPVDMAFAVQFRMASAGDDPVVMISSEDPVVHPIRIVDGFDLDLFIVRNFLYLVLAAWLALAIFLLGFYSFNYLFNRRSKQAAAHEVKSQPTEVIYVKFL